MLSSLTALGLPSNSFSSGLSTIILYAFLFFYLSHKTAHFRRLDVTRPYHNTIDGLSDHTFPRFVKSILSCSLMPIYSFLVPVFMTIFRLENTKLLGYSLHLYAYYLLHNREVLLYCVVCWLNG